MYAMRCIIIASSTDILFPYYDCIINRFCSFPLCINSHVCRTFSIPVKRAAEGYIMICILCSFKPSFEIIARTCNRRIHIIRVAGRIFNILKGCFRSFVLLNSDRCLICCSAALYLDALAVICIIIFVESYIISFKYYCIKCGISIYGNLGIFWDDIAVRCLRPTLESLS